MNLKKLRDQLAPARYQFSIATNMENELDMVNKEDPFLEWRADWYLAWKKGWYSPKARLRTFLLNPSKKDFDSIYKQLNEDDALVKFAECSNFASHAMAILLNVQEITDEYNVCLASAGCALNHTIVILLPKDVVVASHGWKKKDLISAGALVLDPWAMAMGYGVEEALVVKPENYVYSGLLNNLSFPYQSINDATVTQTLPLLDVLGSPNRVNAVGKISTDRKLALEFRLFGHLHDHSSSFEGTYVKSSAF
jgi:hypothetical protein